LEVSEADWASYASPMSRVNTYVNFLGNTEAAFRFYATIFDTESGLRINRFEEMAGAEGVPPMSEEDRQKVLHAELPILAGHVLMGTDMLESMGQQLRVGNNTTISLELDSREEASRFYDQLSEGGSESTGMSDMPWGAFWGCCLDRFGIRWMFSYTE
jgi:PhnB protein